MTQEEKQLLLVDLCARLAYDVQVKINIPYVNVDFDKDYDYITNLQNNCILTLNNISDIQKITDDIKPYLRPMSSMTEEESKEFNSLMNKVEERCINAYGKGGYTLSFTELNDWLNRNMFDYRDLIPMGLALEAKEDMYNIKNR